MKFEQINEFLKQMEHIIFVDPRDQTHDLTEG